MFYSKIVLVFVWVYTSFVRKLHDRLLLHTYIHITDLFLFLSQSIPEVPPVIIAPTRSSTTTI